MGSTAGRPHIKLKDFISWFEIPVYDIHRATAFYNAIYNMRMEVAWNGEFGMAYFPVEKGIGGALIHGPGCVPGDTGTLVYLNAGNDLDGILGRVELAGGRVIMPKTLISGTAGWFGLFIDSEGNRVALHEGLPRGRSTRRASATKKTGGAAPKKNAGHRPTGSRRKR
ncbi:MAG: VOC family protein [Flavobacteriales bacterium]|nr:VOC family protein [Flavobacteriales bacterium]MCB9167002.1 VOC family protein [Flavobacteriales bacterium]